MPNDNINPWDAVPPDAAQPNVAPWDAVPTDDQLLSAKRAATIYSATGVNADQVAQQRRDAATLGVPPAVVEATPDSSRRDAQQRRIEADSAQRPALGRAYSNDDFAKLAHDDSAQLARVDDLLARIAQAKAEKAETFTGIVGNSFARGWFGLRQGLQAQGLSENAKFLASMDEVEAALRDGKPVPADPYQFASMSAETRAKLRRNTEAAMHGQSQSIADRQIDKADYPAPQVMSRLNKAEGLGDALGVVADDPWRALLSVGPESLVQNLPYLAAGAVTPGGIIAKAASAGAGSYQTDFASSFIEALTNAGVDINDPAAIQRAARDPATLKKAVAQATAHAAVVGAFDAASAGLAGKLVLPAKALAARPVAREVANALAQIPVQGTLGAAGEGFGQLAANPDAPLKWGDIVAEFLGEGFSAPVEIGTIAAHEVRSRIAAGHEATASAANLQQLQSAALASKLRARDPALFAEHVNDAAGDGADIYFDGRTLAQSLKPEDLAALPEALRADIAQAVTSGGDVAVSLGDFAAHLADKPELAQHARTAPDAPTAAEAAAAKPDSELRAEVDAALERAGETAPAGPTTVEKLQAIIGEQLQATGRFTPDVVAQYSRLYAHGAATLAERAGVSVDDFIAEHGPRIVSDIGLPAGATLDQGTDGTDGTTPADGASSTPSAEGASAPAAPQGTILGGKPDTRRGAYDPATRTIALLKHADLSTFVHELGHHYLETLVALAARPDAPAQIKADAQSLLAWAGADVATWPGLTLDQKRTAHERVARGFEAYLFEGKAPSDELAGPFARMRAWLVNVYRTIKSLGVELTPEVRGVFDRMLATDAQIAETQARRSMALLFKSAESAGMTPEEWARYQALGAEATEDAQAALQARSIRNMQWLSNAKGRALRKLQKAAEAQRAGVEAEVKAEVAADPVYQALALLRDGKLPEGMELPDGVKSPKLLRADVPADLAQRLDPRVLTDNAERAMPADMIAELFGFSSGDELLQRLAGAQAPEVVIEGMTDQRMLERYGDAATPEGLERAAEEAIRNDARAKFLHTELAALDRSIGKRQLLARAAREYAAQSIAGKLIRALKPSMFRAAESRAGKRSAEAFKAGDIAAAAASKRDQLLQHELARAAGRAQEDVQRGLDYLKKFDEKAPRDAVDPEYREQIDAILERFDLRTGQSLKAIDKRRSLAEWVESQRAIGIEPELPAGLLNESTRKHYRDMTVEEFRGVVDAVRQIEHLGKLKHQLLTAKDQRDFEAVRDEIAQSIVDNAGDRKADTRTPTTNRGRWWQSVKAFGAAHIKAAAWARIFDGGKDGGPFWSYIVRSANERGDAEVKMRAKATEELHDILAPWIKGGKLGGSGKYFPSIKRSLNRESILAIALNTGNDGNLQRLLGGEGWTAAQLQPVLDTLSREDWQTVQAIWDHFESYRPQIAAKQRRVFGTEPEWIEATPRTVVLPDGSTMHLRGGYYPVKYDPAASIRAEEHADAEGAKRQLQSAYGTATTRRSFVKTRAEEVLGRPLLYTLSGVYSGVTDVIHDLAWHEWLIDTNRLLKSTAIDSAMREHYGPEATRQIKSWREAIAGGEGRTQEAADGILSRLRQGVSIAGLGFNVMSALMQPLGFTQSIVRTGATWVGKGVAQYLANPIAAGREVRAKSSFMAERARTRFRELNELRNTVQGQSAARELMGRHAYSLMLAAQSMVDIPTWLGAYEKAIAGAHDEDTAVALADQAVIDAQGSGQTKDLSAIERGGPAQKLFTVFYSFMNTALNLGVVSKMTPESKARFAVNLLLLTVLPATLQVLVKDALTPGDGDDDKLLRKLAAANGAQLLGMVAFAREFSGLIGIATGTGSYGYAGPAGLRLIGDSEKLVTQIRQGEFDEAFGKALLTVVGEYLGLPVAQAKKTLKGAEALADHDTANPAALLFGYEGDR